MLHSICHSWQFQMRFLFHNDSWTGAVESDTWTHSRSHTDASLSSVFINGQMCENSFVFDFCPSVLLPMFCNVPSDWPEISIVIFYFPLQCAYCPMCSYRGASHYKPTVRLLYLDKDLSHTHCQYQHLLADSQCNSQTLAGVEISI